MCLDFNTAKEPQTSHALLALQIDCIHPAPEYLKGALRPTVWVTKPLATAPNSETFPHYGNGSQLTVTLGQTVYIGVRRDGKS